MSLARHHASTTPTNIYFIRHGETEWSLSGRHTGLTDIPLTAHGEEQARAAGRHLAAIALSRVLTSPSQRARRTCALANLSVPAECVPDLTEWNYGDYEGLTSEEVRLRRPTWNVFVDGCPGGESPLQISDRADRLIGSFSQQRGNIALFSHGQFGAVLAARWIGLPALKGQHLSIYPASLSILGYNLRHPEVRVISLWNETPLT